MHWLERCGLTSGWTKLTVVKFLHPEHEKTVSGQKIKCSMIWWVEINRCKAAEKKKWCKKAIDTAYGKNHTALGRNKFSRPLCFFDFLTSAYGLSQKIKNTSVLKIYLYQPQAVLYKTTPSCFQIKKFKLNLKKLQFNLK